MQPNSSPLVIVVVLGWNSEKDLPECLTSLANQDYANYGLIYVDNDSIDHSVRFIQQHYPQVRVIENKANLFFAAGNNVGIRAAIEAGAEFVVILNPDTIVPPNWLSAQVEIMRSDLRIGIVGPKVVFAPGFGVQPDKISKEGEWYINSAGLTQNGFLMPYDRGFGELDAGQYDQAEVVEGVSGTSMLLRVSMLKKIGFLDKRFEMYLEDAELCLRANRADWRVVYTPATYVLHKHMQSTGQQSKDFYFLKSRRNYLLLVGKHYPFKKWLRAVYETFKEAGPLKFVRIFASYFWQML